MLFCDSRKSGKNLNIHGRSLSYKYLNIYQLDYSIQTLDNLHKHTWMNLGNINNFEKQYLEGYPVLCDIQKHAKLNMWETYKKQKII